MLLGGFGFLSRLHGLSIDNLVEAEVVLADGRIVIVNEKEYPGALLSHPPPETEGVY
jgi:FAD/FMN-containing dehydrogenase